MLSARPEINRIDGITWRRGTDITQRGRYIPCSRGLLNRAEHIQGQSLSRLHTRSDGRPKTQQKLAGRNARKDLPPEIGARNCNHEQRRYNVARNDEAPISNCPLQILSEPTLQTSKE